MFKKTSFRSFLVVLCCAFLLCSACPVAFAADVGEDAGLRLDVDLSSAFEENMGDYTIVTYTVLDCPDLSALWGYDCFSIGGNTGLFYVEPFVYDIGFPAYCCGNIGLVDSTFDKSDCPFFFLAFSIDGVWGANLTLLDGTQGVLFGSSSGTLELDSCDWPNDAIVYKSPFSVDSNVIIDDVSTVFDAFIGMVGTVADVFTSYPILYLPIVIGLCGIGIAFYRRFKQ